MPQKSQPVVLLSDFVARMAAAPGIIAASTIYCDKIAAVCLDALKARDPDGIIVSCGPVEWDLHEKHGYSLSADKFLEVEDRNGNCYRVTVEHIHRHNEKPLTSAEREMIRDALTLCEDSAPRAKALAKRFEERR